MKILSKAVVSVVAALVVSEASGGTAAGNALRIRISAGSSQWNGWQYFWSVGFA